MNPTQKEILDRLTALEVKMDSTELRLFNTLDHLATLIYLHVSHLEGFFGASAHDIESLTDSEFSSLLSSFPHAQYFHFVFSTRDSIRILRHELSQLRRQLSQIRVYRKGEKDAERADLLDR